MLKPSNFSKAFAYLCSLINDKGYEFPDACAKASLKFSVSSSALSSEYDYQTSLGV